MFNSLRSRMMLVFISLAIGPLILVAGYVGLRSFSGLEQQSLAMQQQIAAGLGAEISAFIDKEVNELRFLNEVYGLGSVDLERQKVILDSLLLADHDFQDLVLLNPDGSVRVQLSLLGAAQYEQVVWGNQEAFSAPMNSGEMYFGPVRFDEFIREPLMVISIPIMDQRSNDIVAVLIADLRFKPIWELLARAELPGKSDAYLIDDAGLVVAHQDPDVVMRGMKVVLNDDEGRSVGMSGVEVFVRREKLQFGGITFYVVAEQPVSEALSTARALLAVTVVATIIMIIVAIVLTVVSVRQVVKPIEELADSARAISDGDFSRRVVLSNQDEIGDLAYAFNTMTAQIQELLTGLHQEVLERTHAENEVRQLNDELERRVADRTAEIKAVNVELGNYAYITSHDLKAPIRGIMQLTDWLAADYGDLLDDNGREMLAFLKSRALRMHSFVEGILAYSRVGRDDERLEKIALDSLVREIIDILAPPEHIQVNLDVLPEVIGNPIRFQQVFQNLLSNAIRFQDKPEGWVNVSSLEFENHWQFCVADNGPGIAEKYHTKVFKIFQTLSPRDEFESTGIGLAIVKKGIDNWGGRIWIESTVGEGSAFYFTLPKGRHREDG